MQFPRLIVILVLTVILTTPAYAWDWYHPDVKTEFRESDVVCVGRLISTQNVVDKDGFISGTFYSVRVEEDLKRAPGSTVRLYCDNDSGRFEINPGQDYLIFAFVNATFDGVVGPHLTINDGGNYGALNKTRVTLEAVRKLRGDPKK
jgi:hypothetical protein